MQEHPIRAVVRQQGRTLKWLWRRMSISDNYGHRILLPPEHGDSRPAPPWFYQRASEALGVPEHMLRPVEPAPAQESAA